MMNPREILILVLDGLDVHMIFVSTDFFLCRQLGRRHVLYTSQWLKGVLLTLICVEGPFGCFKNFQSVVGQCFYKMLYT